jgi:hypothetical protein
MPDSSYEQRKQALMEEITAAFDGVSRENGVSLSEAWVIDDYGSDEERAEARKEDTETRWQDVPDEDIAYGYSCLSFLDEIGFHYYIPAYMVWYLRYIDNEDPEDPSYGSNTFESLIYALTDDNTFVPSKSVLVELMPEEMQEQITSVLARFSRDRPDLHEYYMKRFKTFTPEQSKAIAHFLEFDMERTDIANAEAEQSRQTMLAKAGFSQEEIDEAWREGEKIRIAHNLPDNQARRALERYWGSFL